MDLKADTITIVTVGPFVDVTDGVTPETGITLGAADQAELIKHGAAAVTDISGATWAALTGCAGYYSLTLTAALTSDEGQLLIVVQDASECLPVKVEFTVLSQAAYNSKYTTKAAGYMDTNIKTIGRADTQETEANNLEAACAAYSVTRGLTGTALPAVIGGANGGAPLVGSQIPNANSDAAGGLPISDAGGLDMDAKLANTNEITAARMGALTDWINGGRLDLILDATLALLNDARSEPGDAAPPANPNAMVKMDYLYKFLINRIQTTVDRLHVYDNAGTNKDHSSVISDDGALFERGKFGVGDA